LREWPIRSGWQRAEITVHIHAALGVAARIHQRKFDVIDLDIQGCALPGTLVDAFTIVIGPQTHADIAFHAIFLLLGSGIIIAWKGWRICSRQQQAPQ